MKKLFFLLVAIVVFSNHDMFLKLDTYFLQPNTPVTIKLFNGTFDTSENAIDRNRMADVSLAGNGVRRQVDTTQWSDGSGMTLLNFTTGEAGTWVVGVSTYARNIELEAADFNEYLEHDGVLDMLDWRKKNNALDQDAVEKYSKHVKTIFQVGDKKTNDWQTALNYPLEFIPMSNPYDLHPGDTLQVRLLKRGAPLADQLVYAGFGKAPNSHSHDHEHAGAEAHEHDHTNTDAGDHHHHHDAAPLRTDVNGNLTVNISNEGIWYLRTIDLVPSQEPGLTHESNWATLTFEVGHSHGNGDHGHDHHQGIPAYFYWLGSLLLVGVLFFWFNRKSS